MSSSIARTSWAASKTLTGARYLQMRREIEAQGLCTEPGTDPEDWFPIEPSGHAQPQRRLYEQGAEARCGGCRVRTRCLIAAFYEERSLGACGTASGIRGGVAPWVRDETRNASGNAGMSTEEAA